MLIPKPKDKLCNQLKEQIPTLDYKIEDFIGIFDGVFPPDFGSTLIAHFNELEKQNGTYSRVQGFDRPGHAGGDESLDWPNYVFYTDQSIKISSDDFNIGFWRVCYPLYAEKYSILSTAAKHVIRIVKLQKTNPNGDGYHTWHFEHTSSEYGDRLLTFIVYLNTIEEGGETEFLYLGKRINPVENRLVIFPSSYTHTHRGNPPFNKPKYILTGWVEY